MLALMEEVTAHKLGVVRGEATAVPALKDLPVESLKLLHNITKNYCRRPSAEMSTVSELHSLVDALKQKAQEEKAAQQAGKGDKPDAQKPNVDMTSIGIVLGAEVVTNVKTKKLNNKDGTVAKISKDGKSAHVVLKETGASHKFAIDSLTKKRSAPASEDKGPDAKKRQGEARASELFGDVSAI